MNANHIIWSAWACAPGVVALAITKQHGIWIALDMSESVIYFREFSDAVNHIIQINKPCYYEQFGSNYELIYLPANSDEWRQAFSSWLQPDTDACNQLVNKVTAMLPWYERLVLRIREITG